MTSRATKTVVDTPGESPDNAISDMSAAAISVPNCSVPSSCLNQWVSCGLIVSTRRHATASCRSHQQNTWDPAMD